MRENSLSVFVDGNTHWLVGAGEADSDRWEDPAIQQFPIDTGTYFEEYPGASRAPRSDSAREIPMERAWALIHKQQYKERYRAKE